MRLSMLILQLVVCSTIWGQTISLPIVPLNINLKCINQFDSLGKKNGYWCEASDDIVSLCFYAGGVKNGFAQVYRKLRQDKYYLQASGYDISQGYIQDGGHYGYNAQVQTAGAIGGFAGGFAGAKAGAALGASIGSLFGGVGAVPGGIIGGFIGGAVGAYFGDFYGEKGAQLLLK